MFDLPGRATRLATALRSSGNRFNGACRPAPAVDSSRSVVVGSTNVFTGIPPNCPGAAQRSHMKFGMVLTCDPPVAAQLEQGQLGEQHGFDQIYCWDSHILKQESSALLTLLASTTNRVDVGLCVTNHVTRHPTVTASLFATLANLVGGDRLTCGIGSGGSAVRAWGAKPGTLADLEIAVQVIQGLTRGEEVIIGDAPVRFGWASGGAVPVLVAASGPRSLRLAGRVADGVVLTAADPVFVGWCLDQVRKGWNDAGRDGSGFRVQVAVPSYVSNDMEEARREVAWYPAFIGSHVANMLRSHQVADDGADVWGYVDARSAAEYRQRGAPGERPAVAVPDEVVDRLTIVGNAAQITAKLRELERIGVTEVAIYLSSKQPTRLVEAYGLGVIPQFPRT